MGLFLDTVPKNSGFLIGPRSHYALKMRYSTSYRPDGLGFDLNHVLESLNEVERFLGISETTWHTTTDGKLGNPSRWEAPHLMVNIGGSSATVGTLREAVDRLRTSGGVPAWVWKATPTREMFTANATFHRFELGVSALALLELLEAIGRILKTSGKYGYSIHFTRYTYPQTEQTAQREEYLLGYGPAPLGIGSDGRRRVAEWHRSWGKFGYTTKTQNAFSLYGRATPTVPDTTQPELVDEHPPEDYLEGFGHCFIRVFVTEGTDDEIEAFEEANEDKWEIKDQAGPVVLGEPGELFKPVNYFRTWGVANKTGPAMSEQMIRPVSVHSTRWSGALGWTSTKYHIDDDPLDLMPELCPVSAGPDCDWVWAALTPGPGWPNLTPAMTDTNIYPFARRLPSFPLYDETSIEDFVTGGLPEIGNVKWRTSSNDPMDGYYANTDGGSYDYTAEGAHEAAYKAIYARLNSGTVLEPGETPLKYLWAWPEPGTFTGTASQDFWNFQATDSPGGSGSPSWSVLEPPELIDAYEEYLDDLVFEPVGREMAAYVTGRYERASAEYAAFNQWLTDVTADVLPSDAGAAGDAWLYWIEDELSEAVARG